MFFQANNKSVKEKYFSMTLLYMNLLGLTFLVCQSSSFDIDSRTNFLDIMIHSLPVIV